MNCRKKQEVISFKVDESLREALENIHNRSEFIRHAVQAALEQNCPLCNGTGVLTPKQRDHWNSFSIGHHLQQCEECLEMRLVCKQEKA